ncbi:aspartate-semialdehyde dehydrogenase [Flavimaricola marinus]|uniref:Aspartate-semialdehyde dehydrogenase n=1 Tax=Flavimaricola marinus TaxID=1819565 RepID=A0A238LAM4_9RHOB|nr:aspartate-semialdehyde dehydrogenase [Flavimaricola marinus]SMY06632.1 Aspartate-semialdehyde dehydrogenase [Flavimaricola marinus]
MNAQSSIRPAAPVIAIVGATGAVGAELIACLEQRDVPLSALRLLASPRSAGQVVPFRGADLTIEALNDDSFEGVDIAFFSAGATISRRFAPLAVAAGARVIDNSSAFRMDEAVPLVVPEANAAALADHAGLIANPNCVAAIATVALAPLQQRWSISRLSLTTYQSASGAGAIAMEELRQGTAAALADTPFEPQVFPHPYAFNLFSHNAEIDPETGYNGEELKVIAETRRILGQPKLPIGVTCVRVPVLRAHSMAVTIRFEDHITPAQIRDCLAAAPGVRIVDDQATNHFPMPSEASGEDDVLVGRIRTDLGDPSGRSIAMFLSGDQLRKGAALNAVQIAEALLAVPA